MRLTGKNILVTGGAGFIGSHLVDRITQENPNNLIVVDNFFLGKEENLCRSREIYPELKIYRLDASNLDAMQNLVIAEKIDVVFDLAVIPLPTSLQYPDWTVQTNISIATTFCNLARWGHIQTFVHCSSSEAYGSAMYVPMDEKHPLLPHTPYAASKAAADHVVLSYYHTFNIDTVIARPFNNYGPRQNPGTYAGIIPIVIRCVRNSIPIEIFGDGEQTRDFIYVRDTADGLVRLYEEEATRGQVINIATGHEISVNELVSKIVHVMRAPDHPVVHKEPRPGDVRRHCGDITQLQQLTGMSPPTINDAYIEETIEWYVKEL